MSDNRIQFTFEINDKGKVKVDGLTKSFVSLDNAVNKVSADLKKQQAELGKSNTGLNNTVSNAGLAGATLTEFGRAISDSNYGIRGMANNLSQLSTLFITLVGKQEEGGIAGVTSALKGLGKQLMGPLGIILAFQVVITLMEKFAMENEKGATAADRFSNSIQRQAESFKFLAAARFEGLKLDSDRVEVLRKEFKELDLLLKNLEAKGMLSNDTLNETVTYFKDILEIRSQIAEKEKELSKLNSADEKDSQQALKNETKATRINQEIVALKEKQIIQERELGVGIKLNTSNVEKYKELTGKIIDEDPSALDFFGVNADKRAKDDEEFMKWLDSNLPEYIDDVDDAVDTYLLNKGKASLIEKTLGLTPDSREKELAALRDKFDAILYETKEFKLAEAAINEKYDVIERQEKFNHYNYMIGGLADFLNKAAQLNEQNKGLARLSIIASAAAASIGIWESWFVKDKSLIPGPARLVGAIATQGALIASTAAALRSLNSGTAPGQDAGGAGAGSSQAPVFNVVGQSDVNQIGRSIAEARNQPIHTYVLAHEVTSAQQLENKIAQTASIG
jgi:hypothetical protein